MIGTKRLKAARKKLRCVGTSKATGDALCFMYANLLAFEHHLSTKTNSVVWPIPDYFEQLIGETDAQIRDNYLKLHKDFC